MAVLIRRRIRERMAGRTFQDATSFLSEVAELGRNLQPDADAEGETECQRLRERVRMTTAKKIGIAPEGKSGIAWLTVKFVLASECPFLSRTCTFHVPVGAFEGRG